MNVRDEGIMDFKELSDKDSKELIERVRMEMDTHKKLEIIFSYVGFDEEGYLSKNYEGGDKRYLVPYGQEYIVCSFIEKKKYETVFSDEKEKLKKKLKNISSSNEKKRLLNAHLEHIEREVKVAVPLFLEGFDKTEIIDPIEYADTNFYEVILGKKPGIDEEPFRGALLKGEGVAYSKFKKHIHQLIDDLNEPQTQAPEKTEPPKNINEKVTFEDYLLPHAKKIFPFLFKNYWDATPKAIAYMVFALIELGYLEKLDFVYHTPLINAINKSFKRKLSRQSLAHHFKKKDFPDNTKTKIIAKISNDITEAFNSPS